MPWGRERPLSGKIGRSEATVGNHCRRRAPVSGAAACACNGCRDHLHRCLLRNGCGPLCKAIIKRPPIMMAGRRVPRVKNVNQEQKSLRKEANAADIKQMARNLRVLIVDDDPAMREMLQAAFWNFGHVAEAVDSAEAALKVFAPDRFDAVITDSCLPGIRGEQLARIVKQQHGEMPVILITGDPTAPLPDGVDYLWHKPFEMDILLKVLLSERRRVAAGQS